MTKIIVLGTGAQPEPNRIRFVSTLMTNGEWDSPVAEPNAYGHIELIAKRYTYDGLDLMFAYEGDRNDATSNALCLGHFNDGIV